MDEADDWEETIIEELYQEEEVSNSFVRKVDNKFYKYSITKLGSDYVKQNILNKINKEHIKLLSDFKERITSISIKRLLYYVYTKYPDYTTESKIKKQILGC